MGRKVVGCRQLTVHWHRLIKVARGGHGSKRVGAWRHGWRRSALHHRERRRRAPLRAEVPAWHQELTADWHWRVRKLLGSRRRWLRVHRHTHTCRLVGLLGTTSLVHGSEPGRVVRGARVHDLRLHSALRWKRYL